MEQAPGVKAPAPGLARELARRKRRRTLELMLVCVVALVPWTIYLGLSLPSTYRIDHWRLAWVGFDVLLLFSLGATAYLAWRGRQAVIGAALATATLLVCDAWFDIALDLGTRDVWASIASAAFIELPLAAFLAHRARMILRLTVRRLYAAAGNEGAPPPLHKLSLAALLETEIHEHRPHGPMTGTLAAAEEAVD